MLIFVRSCQVRLELKIFIIWIQILPEVFMMTSG